MKIKHVGDKGRSQVLLGRPAQPIRTAINGGLAGGLQGAIAWAGSNQKRTLGSITDGTSNTFIFSEKSLHPSQHGLDGGDNERWNNAGWDECVMRWHFPPRPDSKTHWVGPASGSMPSVGEKIWLSAAVFEGAPPSQRQHEAVVTQVDTNGSIQYRFENQKLTLKGTLGAPMLNADGKVVAIHLGAIDPADPLLAKGNPTARFLPYLLSALKKGTSQQAVPTESN